MWRIVSWLSSLAGGLSIVLLIHEAYQVSFTIPLELILAYYKSIANFVFGWMDPFIIIFLEYLQSLFYFDLVLNSHWKHFLIPMFLLVTSSVKVTWSMHVSRGIERKLSAVSMLIYGGLISLISSVLSGAIDLSNELFLPAIIPMLGLIVMNVVTVSWDTVFKEKKEKTRREIFKYYFIRDVLPSIVTALLCVGIGYWARSLMGDNNSILVFILFISFVSLRSLIAGKIEEIRYMPDERVVGGSDKYESASTRVGHLNVRAIGSAFMFIAMNAGMQLAGIGV